MSRGRKSYINILANSNPTSGSINLNSTGNQFTLQFSPPIQIPREAYNIRCFLRSASIWYSFINISSTNNRIYFTDDVGNYVKYSLVLQNGLYSLDLLNSAIQRAMQNLLTANPSYTFPANLITLSADEASQKTIVQINSSGYAVQWRNLTPHELLGMVLNQKMPTSGLTAGNEYFYSTNVANFGSVSSLVISTSVTNNYVYNGKSSSVLSVVPIDVAPNLLINFSPNPDFTYVDNDNLAGASLSQITFTLTDQNLNVVDTNGEYWTCNFTIEYET